MVVGILLAAPVWAVEDLGFAFPRLSYYSLQKNLHGPEFLVWTKSGGRLWLAFYIPGDTWWLDSIPDTLAERAYGAAFDTLGNAHIFVKLPESDEFRLCSYYKRPGESEWHRGATERYSLYFQNEPFYSNTTPRGAGAVYLSRPPGYYYGDWGSAFFNDSIVRGGEGDDLYMCGEYDWGKVLIKETQPEGLGYYALYWIKWTWGHGDCFDYQIDSSVKYYHYGLLGDLYDCCLWANPVREGLAYMSNNGLICLEIPQGENVLIYELPTTGDVDFIGDIWAVGRASGQIRAYFPWGVDTIPDIGIGDVSICFTKDTTLYVAYISGTDGHLHIAHKKVIPQMDVGERESKELAFKTIWRAGEDVRIPWSWGYELYDASGKLVQRGPGPELGKLRRGVYLVRMGERVRKLVVR